MVDLLIIKAALRLQEGLDPDVRGGWTSLPSELVEDFQLVIRSILTPGD